MDRWDAMGWMGMTGWDGIGLDCIGWDVIGWDWMDEWMHGMMD